MSEGFAAAWVVARKIDGWLTEEQARALYVAAASVEPGRSIIEIGSHHGRSTVVIAHAARQDVEVVAVDPYEDVRWGGGPRAYERLLENLRGAGVSGRVRVVRATSEEAVRAWDGRPLGFVYIDGAHDRPSVLLDIDGWLRRLDDGCLIAVHDAFSSVGVTLALLQRLLGRSGFAYVRSVGSLLVLRKRRATSMVASVRLLARLPYFARNLLVKMALRRGWSGVCRMLGHAGDTAPY